MTLPTKWTIKIGTLFGTGLYLHLTLLPISGVVRMENIPEKPAPGF